MSTTTPPVARIDRPARLGDARAHAPDVRRAARRGAARQEAVVGRGDDPQRRHAGALPAGQAVAVLDAEGAARVVRGFGDRQAVEGAAEPVHGKRGHDQALEDVVRDRLVLQRARRTRTAARAHTAAAQAALSARAVERSRRSERHGAALAAVAVGDRHAPVAPERARGDLDARGRLAALVLGEVDERGSCARRRRRAGPARSAARGCGRARRSPRGSRSSTA